MTDLEPLDPTLVADRFTGLGDELIRLLRSLNSDQWTMPTVCPAWTVKDVTAHLLDTACRRLSSGRDGHTPPPKTPIQGYGDLVGLINDLNAQWITAAQRLSPRLLTDLMAIVEPQLAEHLLSLDPWASARFSVAWAGEDESQTWFDIARELTERWHHQQQIRLAVGAPPLDDPQWSEPVFDAFIRALPYRYREIDAPEGAALVVRIEGRKPYVYTLRRNGSWSLLRGEAPQPAAKITLDEQTAWLLFTKGVRPDEARAKALQEGEPELTAPYFRVLSVMA